MKKFVSIVLIMSLLVSIGCSSSYEVSSSANSSTSFDTFNMEVSDRSATIVFQDNSELNVGNIIATPDSTRFLLDNDSTVVVPTHTIKKVVVKNHVIGLLEGFGWGVGLAVATITVVAIANGNNGGSNRGIGGSSLFETYLFFGGILGAGLGIIGGTIGVIAGHSYEYNFRNGTPIRVEKE